MKIVTWAEFKTLPEGTVFQKIYSGREPRELSILGDTNENDYTYAELLPDQVDIGNMGAYRPETLKDYEGEVIQHPSGFQRYGYYDLNNPKENHRWLIWEEIDCKRLAGWLLNPVDACRVQNDDDVVLPVPYLD